MPDRPFGEHESVSDHFQCLEQKDFSRVSLVFGQVLFLSRAWCYQHEQEGKDAPEVQETSQILVDLPLAER